MSTPTTPLLLIGNINSYFSAKVRSYLNWRGLNFEEVHPDNDMYRNYIMKVVGVAQIPVLVDQERGENVFDTSLIIDYCEKHYAGKRSVHPDGKKQMYLGFLLEAFADEWMKLPAMHYRWSFPEQLPFLINDWMALLTPTASEPSDVIKKSMSGLKGVLPVIGVTPSTIPSIEKTYLSLLSSLSDHFTKHDFLFGSMPTLADFSFAGPMYAHLYRDPIPGKIMKTDYPRVAQWLERLMLHSKPRRGPVNWIVKEGKLQKATTSIQSDDEFANDGIPDSLRKIAGFFFDEFVPILSDVHQKLQEFVSRNKKVQAGTSPIPRMIGKSKIVVGGVSGSCGVMPFSLWKLQRADAYLKSIDQSEKQDVLHYYESEFQTGKDLTRILQTTPKLYLYKGTKLYLKEQPTLNTPKL
eukprot:TRINITY_DN9312_c1_g1_i1.p1 TRINITY_DN9312_c1_g1~~TRINITY_DN9312_c1_g1_i1.p1  ORF type:complete len:446 (+),score=82.74 TRINITY_DN9312_c1_g1_i1:113-1339(+)